MKKTVICLLALLGLLLLLCGCTESEISCGVDAENRAFLRYEWNLDLTELYVREQIPILNWIKDRAAELKQQGFTVEHNAVSANEKGNWLRAELIRPGKDRAEALELLREMLTDEGLTPFSAAAVETLPQELQDACRVSLRLEPEKLLATVGVETWPKRLRERVAPWIETCGVRLRVSLPATALPAGETAALEDGLAVKELRVPLTGSGELSLSTLCYAGKGDVDQVWWNGEPRSAADGEALAKSVKADAASLRRLERIVLYAGAALVVLALLFFVFGTVRRRRLRCSELPSPEKEANDAEGEIRDERME